MTIRHAAINFLQQGSYIRSTCSSLYNSIVGMKSRCDAVTRKDRKCKRRSQGPSPYCFQHDAIYKGFPECPCCLSALVGKSTTTLQCGHTFHGTCFNTWVQHQKAQIKTCPMCRRDVLVVFPALIEEVNVCWRVDTIEILVDLHNTLVLNKDVIVEKYRQQAAALGGAAGKTYRFATMNALSWTGIPFGLDLDRVLDAVLNVSHKMIDVYMRSHLSK